MEFEPQTIGKVISCAGKFVVFQSVGAAIRGRTDASCADRVETIENEIARAAKRAVFFTGPFQANIGNRTVSLWGEVSSSYRTLHVFISIARRRGYF